MQVTGPQPRDQGMAGAGGGGEEESGLLNFCSKNLGSASCKPYSLGKLKKKSNVPYTDWVILKQSQTIPPSYLTVKSKCNRIKIRESIRAWWVEYLLAGNTSPFPADHWGKGPNEGEMGPCAMKLG